MNIVERVQTEGHALVRDILPETLVAPLRTELETAIQVEVANQGTEDFRDYGMLLAAPLHGGELLRLPGNEAVMGFFDEAIGEDCIIHVFTSSSLPPGGKNYGTRLHRDRPPQIPSSLAFLACLILLDNFSAENGATRFVPKSHLEEVKPSPEQFEQQAITLSAPAGSVFYFDTRLWHSAGVNETSHWRHALAIGMSSPYVKQKIDLPRALEKDQVTALSQRARRRLGYQSIAPTSASEYYEAGKRRGVRS